MVHLDKTTDTILRGKITITQMKHGYRYGFDAVCLAAFVNGYLRKNKKDLSLADVGSGVGTISLILALKNKNLKISSIENNKEFIEIAKENGDKEPFIIGGGQIYKLVLEANLVDKIYLTKVLHAYDGDTFFPKLGNNWKEVGRIDCKADEKHAYDYDFITLERN